MHADLFDGCIHAYVSVPFFKTPPTQCSMSRQGREISQEVSYHFVVFALPTSFLVVPPQTALAAVATCELAAGVVVPVHGPNGVARFPLSRGLESPVAARCHALRVWGLGFRV